MVGSGNQSLHRYFFRLLRGVKSSNGPIRFHRLEEKKGTEISALIAQRDESLTIAVSWHATALFLPIDICQSYAIP